MSSGSEKVVRVPQLAWWGDKEAELAFPANWEVTECHMNGYNAPRLSEEGFRSALAHPIGTRPIRELARGKKKVVIIFDDLTRPTKVYEIVPYVLEELVAGGVAEEDIEFICALGCHGALTAYDFRKKLGEDIVARFNVYNHNPYENCTYLGKTSRGTPVHLNTEVMNADLKIAIGSIVPHPVTGFGGGAKIVLPGVVSIETITHNHSTVQERARETGFQRVRGMGHCEDNAVLLDMEETCRMCGLDVKIDTIVNEHRDTVALFVGDPIAEYHEGVGLARKHYAAPADRAEVVVANTNAKVNEAAIGIISARSLLPEQGGTLVLLSNNPGGEVPHYLARRFGDGVSGRLWAEPRLPRRVSKFILMTSYKDKASLDWTAPAGAVTWVSTWKEVVDILKADHPSGARAAVIPDATIQFFESAG